MAERAGTQASKPWSRALRRHAPCQPISALADALDAAENDQLNVLSEHGGHLVLETRCPVRAPNWSTDHRDRMCASCGSRLVLANAQSEHVSLARSLPVL